MTRGDLVSTHPFLKLDFGGRRAPGQGLGHLDHERLGIVERFARPVLGGFGCKVGKDLDGCRQRDDRNLAADSVQSRVEQGIDHVLFRLCREAVTGRGIKRARISLTR